MEILSTGEKIKRSRIYNRITLKELCGDKISISKLSCIENGKIKADEESLRYISEKLNVDFDYLVRDVYDQIKYNLEDIQNNIYPFEKLEEMINYNLEYALKHKFNILALKLISILFNLYIENNKLENIQALISKYHNVYQYTKDNEEIVIYYNDMATFFMKTKEYHEAISYFSRIREFFENNNMKDKLSYIYACFYEGVCYKKINENEKALNILEKVIDNIDNLSDKFKGDFYHEFGILNILLTKIEGDKYLNKAFDYKKSDFKNLADFRVKNAKMYFKIKQFSKGVKEIKDAVEIYKREDKKEAAKFLINTIKILYNNNQYDVAFEYIDEAVDLSISIDDAKLIERAYYFKAMLHKKREEFIQAEIYMNLSTDFLLKFANNKQRYKRYNEMGELYYNLGEFKESIKYFTLAIDIEKKI